MGSKISSQSNEKFQFIDGRDVQQTNFTPINQKTSLETRKQFYARSFEGPSNGQIGEFTGLQQFIVPQKYTKFMKQNPIKVKPPDIKGNQGIDPYMFKKSLNVYHGQWKNGKPHGYGKIFNPDQDYYYEGYFQYGLPSFYGVFITQNIQYVGQFKIGMASGIGKYMQKTKIIEGEFKENYPYKKCIQKGNNYIFQGDYQDGLWKKGKLRWMNQKYVYEGQFKQGLMHGSGILKTPQYYYQGDFKQGKRHGKGNIVWANNQNYKGQFNQNQMTGVGEFYKQNKLIYRGQFVSGFPSGQGWISDNNLKLIHGRFKNGQIIEII